MPWKFIQLPNESPETAIEMPEVFLSTSLLTSCPTFFFLFTIFHEPYLIQSFHLNLIAEMGLEFQALEGAPATKVLRLARVIPRGEGLTVPVVMQDTSERPCGLLTLHFLGCKSGLAMPVFRQTGIRCGDR